MSTDNDQNAPIILREDIREYCEGYAVEVTKIDADASVASAADLGAHPPNGMRWIVRAFNEGHHNSTEIDLVDLLTWLRRHRPELLESAFEDA